MKFKNTLIAFSLSIATLFAFACSSFADTAVIKNGKIKNIISSDNVQPNHVITRVENKLLNKENKKNQFLGYLTSSWAPVSTYGRGKTYKFTGTLSVGGAQLGVEYEESISSEIPANPKKPSKLGLYGDIEIQTYEQKIYVNGILAKKSIVKKAKALDYNTIVVYKK